MAATSRRDRQRPVCREREVRIPGDLPEVPVRIGEVAGASAPRRVLRRLHHLSARGVRLRYRGLNLTFLTHIVRERDAAKSRTIRGDLCIASQALTREQTQRQRTRLKENHLAPADRRRFEPKLLVKRARAREIG